MKSKFIIAVTFVALSASLHAADEPTIAVGTAPQAGEVNIGGPGQPSRAPAATEASSGTGPQIPKLGGQVTEPGKAAQVYTTMSSAAQAGVNPLATPAAVEAASSPAIVSTRIEVTDETILGRLAALPFLFKVGALLLLGIAGYALREWKRS